MNNKKMPKVKANRNISIELSINAQKCTKKLNI